jgi:GNAT superfamily N-acetyltransferase
MPDYRFEPALTRATLEDYVALFAASFGGDDKLNRAYLQWQYCDNPHGTVIGVDAFHGDTLAGHYAIIPRRYTWRGEAVPAALSVNTATHPEHQGKGLFVKLAQQTYEAAAACGVRVVIGAANANSVGGFLRRLGFSELGQIGLYLLAGGPRPDAATFDLSVDEEWLRWRLANPSRRYQAAAHGDGSTTLVTIVRNVPFNLARLPSGLLQQTPIATTPALLPLAGFTPWFGPGRAPTLKLPTKLQPSPWHVIWKCLDPALEAETATGLRMTGLSMDTL